MGVEEPADAPAEGPAPRWSARAFSAFKSPAYRRFYVGQGLSLVGMWARQTALAWLVYDMTGSKWLLGTVRLASFLPLALLSPFGGALADRADKRLLLARLNAGLMVCACGLTALVATGAIRPSHVLVFAALTGVLVAFEVPARQAFVVDMVGKKDLHAAIAMNSALFNLTLFLGPMAATLLLALGGMTAVFAFDAATYLAAIVGFAGMRLPPAPPRPPSSETAWAHVSAGVRYVRGDPAIRRLLIL